MRKTLKNFPSRLLAPLDSYEKASDEGAMHKSLIDLGGSLLIYIVGVMFGEYKRSGEIDENLETAFYNFSNKSPALGHFQLFLRDYLSKNKNTILSDKFEKSKTYESASAFIFEFNLLKKVIDAGTDEGFSDKMDSLRQKNQSVSQKGLIEFFQTFITLRNIYAHPEDKAGPKDKKRNWPLTGEYYDTINPHMHSALTEIIEDFEILKSYKPILAKTLDDQGKKGKFEIEIGTKGSELELKLSNEDLRFVSSDERYLLDPDDKLFIKFYYNNIPQLNPDIAKKIIDNENAKAMEPQLSLMIDDKLKDDSKIDDMEYLILRDTAKTYSISIGHLFKLIEKSKNKLQIKASVGTPDNKGDIFIKKKSKDNKFTFNPWWLHYFSMVPKIDKNIIKTEQTNLKKSERQIKKLKNSIKTLPVSKRLENAKKNLKNKKAQKSKQLKSINADKTNEINDKILKLSTDLEEYSIFNQWSMHKNLWNEISQYVNELINESFINHDSLNHSENEYHYISIPNAWQIGNLAYYYWAKIYQLPSDEESKGILKDIGEKYNSYSRLRENETLELLETKFTPINKGYYMALVFGRKFQWLPKNIDESLIEASKKPASMFWTSQDDNWVAKIDIDGSLGRKKAELNQNLLQEYESELLELGTNVRCIPKGAEGTDENQHFMPAEKFLTLQNEYDLESIYSRIWTVDRFYNNGNILTDALSQYHTEMITILRILSNVHEKLNNYAIENGITNQTIVERNERFNRLKKIMFKEYEKDFPVGTLFRPSIAQDNKWRDFARNELDLSDYLYDKILSNFRFGADPHYSARKYLKEQRDKHKPDTKEYLEWNQKIKEL